MDDHLDTVDAPRNAAEVLGEAPTTYERDFYLWCFEQAELLRLRRFSQADLPNIIEELESMGRSLRSSLRSSYRLVIAHLLKWQFQPEMRSTSWTITLLRERYHIDDIEAENPSLKADAPSLVENAYRKARKEAQLETKLPLSTFPAECPYTMEQLRDDEWFPS
jgi:hypothetical protein